MGGYQHKSGYQLCLAKEMWNYEIPHEIVDAPGSQRAESKKGRNPFWNLQFSSLKLQSTKNINVAIKPGEKIP